MHLLVLFYYSMLCITYATSYELTENEINSAFQCPTWYVPSTSNTSELQCICGATLNNKIKCVKDEHVEVVIGNCMTSIVTEGETVVVGSCPYAPYKANPYNNVYTKLPKNISELDDFMCGWMNRTGLLCSQCKSGLSLAVLSYQRRCIRCSNMTRGLAMFLFLLFIPTTIFFFIVMCCRIDISSGPMNAALSILQATVVGVDQQPSDFIFRSKNPLSFNLIIFLLTFYGIWNLDFFRYVIPPICISKTLNSLQAEALEYIIAIHPFLLVVVTYICVEMYDSGNPVVLLLWMPFKKLLNFQCFRNLNIKYSLLTTFATFIQLPYTKILLISINILNYTHVKNSTGDTIRTVVAMDASITYSSKNHIPYVILAIIMLSVFNLTPLFLLLFYPTKCFQLLLGRFPRVNWHPLHAFMDIFQSCYKNGTDGTRDYRYFAAFNLLFRILILFPIDNHVVSIVRFVLVPLIFSYSLALFKPYQENIYNIWDSLVFFLYALLQWMLYDTYFPRNIFEYATYICHLVLFIYFGSLIVVKLIKTLTPGFYDVLKDKIILLRQYGICATLRHWRKKDGLVVDLEIGGTNREASCYHEMSDSMADRIQNPQDYQSLLVNMNASNTYGIKQ